MPIPNVLNDFQQAKEEAHAWLSQEIQGLRSGRVTPSMVETIPVEAYGARTPLNGVASVSSSDARTLVISPWDANVLPDIQRALTEAQLSVQPIVDGNIIRLSFPSLTEEVREQTIRTLHKKAEEARVRLRQARDEGVKTLKSEQEQSVITEDDFHDGKKQLDERITQANADIADMVAKKEEDIKQI